MFKTRFHLRISPNYVRLTRQEGSEPVEAWSARPFSYGEKLVADRETLTDVLTSVFKQARRPGLRGLFILPLVDVEASPITGDDEAALRAALEAVGVTKVRLTASPQDVPFNKAT
jgi:hypothetical protein